MPVINDAYSEIVTWKRNLFMVSFGKTGKTFISIMASLFLTMLITPARNQSL